MTPDQFISRIYRESSQVTLANFPCWSLDLLQQVISFDGAIWGTGHTSTQAFHTQASVDVDQKIFSRLKDTLNINPIFAQLMLNPSSPVDMADVINDDDFYQSDIYQQCFQPFGIERILSSIHIDDRSGIFTLLTLYRYDRQHTFSSHEKAIQQQLLFHLLSASSHRQFLALKETFLESTATPNPQDKYAICDSAGIYHAVEAGFLDIIECYTNTQQGQKFPFAIKNHDCSYNEGSLHINLAKLGDLYRISIRLKNQLDDLTDREKQVVAGICQGNTFKQIAKQLALSPSTVSNHLYRIYLKLGINSRSELVSLVKPSV
ncbi:MAG: helix-turn-helix transcriptional regulator [Alteromonadaceae bacterium]|nr:helix-turn-helix transcriptional regulator [Alteromonadaceae bacterium]